MAKVIDNFKVGKYLVIVLDNIEKDFNTEDYPDYTLSGPFVNPDVLMDIM